ncbi:hypothetical protein ABMA28_009026 [Loxostege sticticalis]|uniref:Peptidase S1 domain-containing protein n=1 Tax=Loxostege sticticalis TaxID=481309 RepID=A0ABD0SFZ6_LOXSC
MMWTVLFVVALAVGQVPARPDAPQYIKADFVENVRGSGSRILSGWEAYPGQLPYHVSLRMVNPDGAGFACGASLIHKNWVMTAAHCTAGRDHILVRTGVVQVMAPEFTTETREWYNHYRYVDEWNQVQPNDISLLRLHEDVPFTRLTQPIRLQSRADAFRNYDNIKLIASGHGTTWTGGQAAFVLNWVYLRGITNALCEVTFGAGLITENAMCTTYYNVSTQSTCHGDSGGPLVHVENDGVPTLVGVASFVAGISHGGCHSGHPAGFVRTGPYHDWFTQVTGLDFDNREEEDETEAPTEPPTEPPTEAPTEPPTQPPTEAPTEPPTEAPTEPPTEPPTTPAPEEESEEDDSESSEEDEDDPELKDLLKRLEVLVKVKVRMSKLGKKIEHGFKHNKTITHRR